MLVPLNADIVIVGVVPGAIVGTVVIILVVSVTALSVIILKKCRKGERFRKHATNHMTANGRPYSLEPGMIKIIIIVYRVCHGCGQSFGTIIMTIHITQEIACKSEKSYCVYMLIAGP